MRTRVKKPLIVLGLLAMTLGLSGCFFSEQQISIDPEGKAEISTTFWFDKSSAGDEGTIAIQSLLFCFPELQTNYEFTERAREDYMTFTFRSIDKVDINQNKYITFTKREDGSYYFEAKIPKIIEEKSDRNEKALTVRLTLPAEIEMANSMNYEDKTVEWELRQNDFTRDIILKAFTKNTAQRIELIESPEYDWPSSVAVGFVEAVEEGNLELAYEFWQNKELAKDAIQALMKKEKAWGQWGPVLTGHHVNEVSQDEYSVSVPFINSRLGVYRIQRFNNRWLIISQDFMDFGMEDNRES